MPRIRCLYHDCLFLDDNLCTAPSVEIDPDLGCTTHSPAGGDLLEGKWDDDVSLEDLDLDDLDIDDIDLEDIELEDDDGGDVDDWLDEI
ncbi:MAG: hypothetical protein ISR59_13590 [Anaerolineales bacterium]|nr:hypothetical protein [Anaerolineales bacterium]